MTIISNSITLHRKAKDGAQGAAGKDAVLYTLDAPPPRTSLPRVRIGQ